MGAGLPLLVIQLATGCRASFSRVGLLAWANNASQTSIIDAIIAVPQRLPTTNAQTQNLDLLRRPSGSVGRLEILIDFRIEVFKTFLQTSLIVFPSNSEL